MMSVQGIGILDFSVYRSIAFMRTAEDADPCKYKKF